MPDVINICLKRIPTECRKHDLVIIEFKKAAEFRKELEMLSNILEIEVGIKDYKTAKLGFPVIVKLTEEKPVCNLGFRFDFDAATFQFESYYEDENDDGIIGHKDTIWANKGNHNVENAIVITPLIQDYSKNGVYVAEVLTPHPQTFEHFMC